MRFHTPRLLAALLIITASCLRPPAVHADDEKGFVPLFNGRDLSGWTLVNTPPQTWSVQDQMLICTGKPIGEIRTDKMYQNFILEVEWRHMKPRGNAGIFVWADDITARGVPFHRSIEVQVLENAYGNTRGYTTHGDIFPIHGAKMTPVNGRGGSRAFPTENRSNPSPEWNHYRIECNAGNISLAVNGKVVTRGQQASPSKGYICLESEGGIVHYRNLRIKELPATPIDDQQIATAARGFRSLYSGLDLNGWRVGDQATEAWHPQDWVLKFDGKVPLAQSELTSNEKFGRVQIVFDVRLLEPTSRLQLQLGKPKPLEIQAEKDPLFAQHLLPRGKWNRIICTKDGAQSQITINGKRHDAHFEPSEHPLTFMASGPLDLANIYVRKLDP